MHLQHIRNVVPATDGLCKVTALAWSPNNKKLGVVTVDRVVYLYDENGDRRDKFSTKAADKAAPKSYVVTGMVFSPDSTKLAIAQSDNIVFVYKLGAAWDEKKSICNKFPQSSSVTTLTWPSAHPNEVIFGLADGKVKIGQLRTNKPATLYGTGSYCVSTCSSPDGNAILTGHMDGSIYRFQFQDALGAPSHTKLCVHSCVPSCLSWGASILAAGANAKVTFYDTEGDAMRTFDYEDDSGVKEFGCSTFNPSGESAVVGNYNSFYTYTYNSRTNEWDEENVKRIENLYSVTAIGWKQDGSRVALGNLCGSVDLYDACIKRTRYKGKFEFTYVSLSQVIVKRLATGTRIVLHSQFGYEIQKINIFQDRFLVAHTPETILLGDLDSCKLSEIQWASFGGEKFFFEHASVCMVYKAGELYLVEYGRNDILGSCRTEFMNPHLISVRINERPPVRTEEDLAIQAAGGELSDDNKKIAYLMDIQTIRVMDLVTGVSSTVAHDTKIDWLELNGRGTIVLFRDRRRRLHLYDVIKQTRSSLLNYCNYVQWVPQSDVVVAQNRNMLCVWYNIFAPDKVTSYTIKGDVEEIERAEGRTEVIVDEGIHHASYMLDEGLIAFGTAVEDRQYHQAMQILDKLELTPETDAMWKQLLDMALRVGELYVAQRCAAAIGDVSKARFLQKTAKIAQQAKERLGTEGSDFWMVRARLAMLKQDLSEAEGVFVEQGKVDEAIEMYQIMHRYDEAIAVAEARGHPETENMRRQYFQFLLESKQEEKAAQLKQDEGDERTAIDLFLQGGFPAKAMRILEAHPQGYGRDVIERVAGALSAGSMHDKAGVLLERMGDEQRALDSYLRGHAFREAVELARRSFPSEVVRLEKEWGDFLMSQKQTDAAINHYIEAGAHTSAINAALQARQYNRAVQLVDDTLRDPDVAKPFYHRIAKHYRDVNKLHEAKRFFIKAGEAQEAVEMFTNAGKWDEAHKVAVSCMSEAAVSRLYVSQAQQLEAEKNLKQAEKLYLTVNEHDMAISMYKRARQYQNMIRLVSEFRRDLLKETHLHLAQQLEMEGDLKEAESHYVSAGEWESGVNMYRSNNLWEDAIRVAKFHGGADAGSRIAYTWAVSLGGEAGSKLLNRMGLVEQAIDYALENGSFEHAFELARTSCKAKVGEVHLKHALFLEDEGRFKEAEEEFISAGKPKEAIDMYVHQTDWTSAMRVAEKYDPTSISDVLVAQGRNAVENGDLGRAEGFFVDAKKPEMAMRAYVDAKRFPDALRVTKKHIPHKIREVNAEIQRLTTTTGREDHVANARMWESSRDYGLAIDEYLAVTVGELSNVDELVRTWMHALDLADTHEKRRSLEVAEAVADKLISVERYAKAGELYQQAERWKDAIDAYIRAKDWDACNRIAQSMAPQYADYVRKAHRDSLENDDDADGLLDVDVDSALEIYAQKKEWQKALEVASRRPPNVYARFAVPFAEEQLADGNVVNVIEVFSRYGGPAVPSQYGLFQRILSDLLSRPYGSDPDVEVFRQARDMLYKTVSNVKRPESSASPAQVGEFDKLLLLSHYMARAREAEAEGLAEIAARLRVSALRFAGHQLPADRAFYEAGMAAKDQKWMSLAFVLLNRYLDLSEAIDDGDLGMVDNTDFLGTDIPAPLDISLPKQQYLPESKREQVRDWVLAVSMDNKIEQELPKVSCSKCSAETYDGSLVCGNCSAQFPPCIVSGFPVTPAQSVRCTVCSSVAIKAHWNKYVLKTGHCAWCQSSQSPFY